MRLTRLILGGICMVFSFQQTVAQKKVIDKEACDQWESLEEINGNGSIISNNGTYAVYQTSKPNSTSKTTLISLKNNLREEFYNISNPTFTVDSKRFLARLPGDSLLIENLKDFTRLYIKGVEDFALPAEKNGNWFIYKLKDKKVVITKFDSAISFNFDNVKDYQLSATGKYVLIHNIHGLILFEINKGLVIPIPNSSYATIAVFDKVDDQIAFYNKNLENIDLNVFDIRIKKIKKLKIETSNFTESGFKVSDDFINFSKNGRHLYFSLRKKQSNSNETFKSPIISKNVNIWSYKDKVLLPRQIKQLNESKSKHYKAIIDIQSNRFTQLENDSMRMVTDNFDENSYSLLISQVSDNEFYWNGETQRLILVSLNTGVKKNIGKAIKYPGYTYSSLSIDEQFLIWFDPAQKGYFTYETRTGLIRNVSKSIDEPLIVSKRGEADKIANRAISYGIVKSFDNYNNIYINSANDIYQIDLSGKKQPINCTNGYGSKHDIRFRFINNQIIKTPDGNLLVCAFNNKNKQNGFWKVRIVGEKDPIKLVMDDHAWYFNPTALDSSPKSGEDVTKFPPLKAKNSNIFIVRRMSSSESPNLFTTTDFTSFKELSNIQTENNYPKVKSILVTWNLPNGLKCDGILHQPEHIDSTKKYPVIFNYYERRSEGLNFYHTPLLSGANINIPWYVSSGYLVFEPDFYYQTGKTAQSVIETVISATKKLASFSYVDTSKMGCQGQSFGGYQTNVIATGTHIFKAACEMAGPTNIISEYGSLRPGGHNNQSSADQGQRNLAEFPWKHPELFIENSPVFHIGSMTTPLLIVHNKNDSGILFTQAIELYLGMRRAGKKVWMLDYDNEGHSIAKDENKFDFTIRMKQFFDYYLKDEFPPKWMTESISAKDKGIVSGLDLDSSGKQP